MKKQIIILCLTLLTFVNGSGQTSSTNYYYPISQGYNEYGFINSSGQIVIPAKYTSAEECFSGMYKVGFGEEYGFIDSLGKELPARFETVSNFNNGIAIEQGNGLFIIDKRGTRIHNLIYPVENFKSPSCELIKVFDANSSPRQYGFCNKQGELVIPFKFTSVGEFSEGLCRVTINNLDGFIDTKGKFVIIPKYSSARFFSEGLAKISTGYIDKNGNQVINYEGQSFEFHNGFAKAKKYLSNGSECFTFIDKTGTEIIKPSRELFFYEVKDFSSGLAPVGVGGKKWGYINSKGQIVIEPIFDEADCFKGNLAHVKITNGTMTKSGDYIIGEGYIDTGGKFVSFKDFSDKKCFSPTNNTLDSTNKTTTEEVYKQFKKDSTDFRILQGKNNYADRLNVFELGYVNQPGKSIKNASEIEKKGSYTWVMKDPLKKVSLIATISQNSSEEWGTRITVFSFDKLGNLNFIREERNTDYDIANQSQNWVSDKYSQPCDYYFVNNKVSAKKSYCDVNEVTSYAKKTIIEILNEFGIKY